MTLYQKAYASKLSGAAYTTYINSLYDTKSVLATQPTSKYAVKKALDKGNVHAYTRKLTVMNGGTSA